MKTNINDIEKLLLTLQDGTKNYEYVHPNTIPPIELYIEQLTTFMDQSLANSKRHPDDKILTKTMINNYTKNHVIPAPTKKLYDKNHLISLIITYYLKDFLSISDIKTIMEPVTELAFENKTDMVKLYEKVFYSAKEELPNIYADIVNKLSQATDALKDVAPEKRDTLTIFDFICTLSYDIYVKKRLIESIIDTISENEKAQAKPDSEKSKKAAKKAAKAKK